MTLPSVTDAADRHIFLSLMDSAIMSAWLSHCMDEEAQSLFAHANELAIIEQQAIQNKSRVYAETIRIKLARINQRHSLALHRASEFRGQHTAYQAIRKYMARLGYKFV